MIYTRPDDQVFASNAKTTEIDNYPDIARGWGVTLEQTAGKPPLQWFNALGLRTDQAIQYFLQNGVATWGETTEYPKHAIVKHDGKVWSASKQHDGNEPAADSDYWQQIALSKKEIDELLEAVTRKIPVLITQKELAAGISEEAKAINAKLLAEHLDKNKMPLMTQEELEEGVSEKAKTVSAKLLSYLKAEQMQKEDLEEGTSSTSKTVSPLLLRTFFQKKQEQYTVIYPSGGSAEKPSNISSNNRYILENPFKGSNVICLAEIEINGSWGNPGFIFAFETNSSGGRGVVASQLDNTIVVQAGPLGVCAHSSSSGNPFNVSKIYTTAPCRVKVWRVNE